MQLPKIFIGVDIGKGGAIVALNSDGSVLFEAPMPKIGTEIDERGVYDLLTQGWGDYDRHVGFEQLGVILGTGKNVAFSMGYQLGLFKGICTACDIRYTAIHAKTWQKEMFMGVDPIEKLSDKNKSGKTRDTKAMALIAHNRIFPSLGVNFGARAKKANDGLIDARLIAEYMRRHF